MRTRKAETKEKEKNQKNDSQAKTYILRFQGADQAKKKERKRKEEDKRESRRLANTQQRHLGGMKESDRVTHLKWKGRKQTRENVQAS